MPDDLSCSQWDCQLGDSVDRKHVYLVAVDIMKPNYCALRLLAAQVWSTSVHRRLYLDFGGADPPHAAQLWHVTPAAGEQP